MRPLSGTEDWKIPSPSGRCGGCDTPFHAHESVTAVLELADPLPRRVDWCAACVVAADPTRAIFWRRVVPAGDKSRPTVDYAMLREVFERLIDRPGDVYHRLSYLVALVLVRKRQLRLKAFEQREGREVMIVTRGAEYGDRVVPAPYLSADDLVETRDLLTRLLAADLSEDDLATLAARSEGRNDGAHPAPEASDDGDPSAQVPSQEALSRASDTAEGAAGGG